MGEEGPESGDVFAFPTRDDEERPRALPFVVFFDVVIDDVEDGPEDGSGVPIGGTKRRIGRQDGQMRFLIGCAQARLLSVKDRPKREPFVVPAVGEDLLKAVGDQSDGLGFVPQQGPGLPTLQSVTLARMEHGVKIVTGMDVAFLALRIEREKDKEDVVAPESILEVAVERHQGGVVFVRIAGALLEIERENAEPIPGVLLLCGAAGDVDQLTELPAVLLAEPVVSH